MDAVNEAQKQEKGSGYITLLCVTLKQAYHIFNHYALSHVLCAS